MEALTIAQLKEAVPKTQKHRVSEDYLDTINKLRTDPLYGQEFLDTLVGEAHLLKDSNNKWSFKSYVNAIKFYSLMCGGNFTQAEAYIKVFPERLEAIQKKGFDLSYMGSMASQYNRSRLLTKIREQAMIPIHLLHQKTVHRAIKVLLTVAEDGRSEMARVSAASTLLKELKAPESMVLEEKVVKGLSSFLKPLVELTKNIASEQVLSITRGEKSVVEIIDVEIVNKDD